MGQETTLDLSTPAGVLSMDPTETAAFIREAVRTRSLSWIVSELNRMMLSDAREEREEARKALDHLGFI